MNAQMMMMLETKTSFQDVIEEKSPWECEGRHMMDVVSVEKAPHECEEGFTTQQMLCV